MAQTFVDDGTSYYGVVANFTSIFSPDPVPNDLCHYLKETTNSTVDVVPPGGQRPTSLSYKEICILETLTTMMMELV